MAEKRRSAKVSKSRRRYENQNYLIALGEHCRKLRQQKGFSIDRLSKESEQLSTSVVHRLETASGVVTVSALFRYAEVLGLHPKKLLDFDFETDVTSKKIPLISLDEPKARQKAFATHLPVYSLKAAAGYFGSGSDVSELGWTDVSRLGLRIDKKMFVAQVFGHSMEPLIRDGAYAVFRADPIGTKQGKVVLAQYRGPADPDTGGSYTIKKYSSVKMLGRDNKWRHQQIILSPANSDYEPIVLEPKNENDFKVIAEFIEILR